LYFEPKSRGTKPTVALDYLNKVLTRRAVMFLVSDFQTEPFKRELSVTGRRHDLVAVTVVDPREEELPNVGLVTLEDAETGEQVEVNTRDRRVREAFRTRALDLQRQWRDLFRSRNVDVIRLRTDQDYLPAMRTFFKTRERRAGMR
jgi:uncharacterized protein (DUF58 family)